MKDIPIPPVAQYKKLLLHQTESFLQRLRWKVHFFLNPETPSQPPRPKKETYGFKTTRTAPQTSELTFFEQDLAELVSSGIHFRNFRSKHQRDLSRTVRDIQKNKHYLLKADKTTNLYQVSADNYKKLLLDNITRNYQQTTMSTVEEINEEAREIACTLNLGDRVEVFSDSCAFVNIKDHKDKFETDKPCRLINPAKSQIGKISKQILQKINTELRERTRLTQWQSTKDALEWFNDIPNKPRQRFIQMDICDFYPSISKELLNKALDFADRNCQSPVSQFSRKIIIHARQALLFTDDPNSPNKIPWRKQGGLFDVTMGAPDGAEICELVGLFLLHEVREKIPELKMGLYRDDGLGYHRARIPVPRMEKIRQELRKIFQAHGLKITVEKPNLPSVNFLDVTMDLENELHKPYRKPNDRPLYVHRQSNHPPNVLRAIPKSINKRLTSISSSAREFNAAKGDYQEALNNSGYKYTLEYDKPDPPPLPNQRNRANDRRRAQLTQLSQRFLPSQNTRFSQNIRPNQNTQPDHRQRNQQNELAQPDQDARAQTSSQTGPSQSSTLPTQRSQSNQPDPTNDDTLNTSDDHSTPHNRRRRRKRCKKKRDILWFNPPWNDAVETNVGEKFLDLVSMHFPRGHPLRPILNRSTIKVSYCCCKNMEQIIKSHNSKITNSNNREEQGGGCNCQRRYKENCPIKDNCNQKNVIYQATVLEGEEKKYIGSTIDFKKRWYKHKGSFRNDANKGETTLSSHIWEAGLNPEPQIKWEVIARATPYQKGGRNCDLCLTEKMWISQTFHNPAFLNQRSELAVRCRHRRKHLLAPLDEGT